MTRSVFHFCTFKPSELPAQIMHQNTPLYGLVLAGGESRRMGSAKAALEYHGLPESDRMVDLLRRSCTSVYVGCREDQLSSLPEHHLPISDLPRFAGNGPIGSLLSAWTVFPDVDWFVVGCDYPFFGVPAVEYLLQADASEGWSGFHNNETQEPEPLLGIYRQSLQETLFQYFEKGGRSLRKFLHSLEQDPLLPEDPRWIRSIDTREDYLLTLQTLRS